MHKKSKVNRVAEKVVDVFLRDQNRDFRPEMFSRATRSSARSSATSCVSSPSVRAFATCEEAC